MRWYCGLAAVVRSVARSVIQSSIRSVVRVSGLVCGLVDGPICGPVRAFWGLNVLLHAPYSGWPAANIWILVGKRACVLIFPESLGSNIAVLKSQPGTALVVDAEFRTAGVAGLFRCCCGADAVLL